MRGFVRANAFPERALRAGVPTLLDAHRPHLAARAAQGCRNAAHLWRELQAAGFAGSYSTVREAFASMRGTTSSASNAPGFLTAVRTIAPPSPRRACAWLLGWAEKKLDESERSDWHRLIEALCRIEPTIATARSLAQRLFGLVCDHDVHGFDC